MADIIDDRTPHLNLPLPNVNNLLEDDVARLRTALGQVDTVVQQAADDIDALETRASTVEGRAKGLEDRATTAENKLAALTKGAASNRDTLVELSDAIDMAQQTASNAAGELPSIKDNISSLRGSLGSLYATFLKFN